MPPSVRLRLAFSYFFRDFWHLLTLNILSVFFLPFYFKRTPMNYLCFSFTIFLQHLGSRLFATLSEDVFFCFRKKELRARRSSLKLCFGNIDRDIVVKSGYGTSTRDFSVKISYCGFHIGSQNDKSDSAGEYTE